MITGHDLWLTIMVFNVAQYWIGLGIMKDWVWYQNIEKITSNNRLLGLIVCCPCCFLESGKKALQ